MTAVSKAGAEPSTITATDGRRARRERGRIAVIEAMIDLVFELHIAPSADQVAERAGVSVASLFRYFDNLDDLRSHATSHYFERFAHLFEVADIGDGTLAHRIGTFTSSRLNQHEVTDPMARLVRSRALTIATIDATLRRLRATGTDQIWLHFEEELGALSAAARDDVVATISSITSFESWDQFRHDHGRSPAQTRRAWVRTLTAILPA